MPVIMRVCGTLVWRSVGKKWVCKAVSWSRRLRTAVSLRWSVDVPHMDLAFLMRDSIFQQCIVGLQVLMQWVSGSKPLWLLVQTLGYGPTVGSLWSSSMPQSLRRDRVTPPPVSRLPPDSGCMVSWEVVK